MHQLLIPPLFLFFLENVEPPYEVVFQENAQFRNAPPHIRVEKMFEQIQSKLPGKPKFLLCILAERKNSHVYGKIILLNKRD